MARAACKLFYSLILLSALAVCAQAQTATYHLHKEASTTTGLFQLKTAGPDGTSLAVQSANLRNVAAGEYLIKSFDTQSGVPNASGTIPAGSPITFTLWMRKTTSGGTIFPRARLTLNSAGGTLLGTATGATALTSTLTKYTFTATTSANVTMAAGDRFHLWVGVNLTAAPTTNTTAELDVEGALNGNFDSLVVVPLPARPTIGGVSPTAGPAGASVTVSGSNFGATQGASTITFNGVAAAPSSWSATSIVAPVPAAATTGPVVVTVNGAASNGVTFSVGQVGSISGTVSRASDGALISGAQVSAFQSGAVKGTGTTGGDGSYSISGLLAGTYDVQASASGLGAQTQTGQQVTGQSSTAVNFSLNPTFITYIYDELGRLVGAVDPGGETVRYVYDAVGNLTAITRQSSAQVSVVEFTPNNGPVGTPVTVYGTGFSTVASQNTIKFNGVVAPVVSATATTVVTSVPAGATSGPISVTSPAGTASSSTPFTVGNPTAPSITGFAPAAGSAGAAVTLTGTNFYTSLSNNKVAFNGVRAVTTAATATSITTAVPTGARSGRISVTTPDGRAESAADFFIPPPPYTGAEVESTGRISHGESKLVAVNTADKVAMLLFDGAAGQRTSLSVGAVSFPGTTTVRIYRPDDASLTSVNVSQGGTGFIDAFVLPVSGTYAIIIDPAPSSVGGLTLALHDATDPVAPITAGGPTVTATATTPGQNARLTFAGTAGQRVSIDFGGNTIPGTTSVFLVKPDGTSLTSSSLAQNATRYIDTQTLPTAGTYTIVVDPQGANVGSMTVRLYDATDFVAPILPGGPTVTATTTTPGQNARLTFVGAFGQRVSINFGGNTIPGTTSVFLLKPDGTTLTSSSLAQNGTRYIDTLTLPMPGTYTILVDPSTTNVGGMTVQLFDANEPAVNTITPGGEAVTVTTSVPGQNARLTFGGTQGQRVSLAVTAVTVAGTNVTLLNPDGTQLATVFSGTGGAFLDTQTLPASGAYTIVVDPSSTNTGSATLQLFEVPPDDAGPIVPGGAPVTVTSAVPGHNQRLTFAGAYGQRVTINFGGNTIPGSTSVSLLRPDGTTLTSSSVSLNGTRFIDTQTLPAGGTYTILVDPQTVNTGNMTVQLNDASEVNADAITPGGPAVTATTTQAGQVIRLTFEGTAGQRVSLNVTAVSLGSSSLSIFNPDGTALVNGASVGSGGGFIEPQTLPATGTYTLILDPSSTGIGSATLQLFDVPADEAATITPGGPPVTVTATTPGQNARLTFSGAYGQRVTINFSGNTIPGSTSVSLLRPDGTSQTSSSVSLNGTRFFDTQILSMPGVYTIVVDPQTVNVGNMTVQLFDASDVNADAITPGGPPVTVTTTAAGQAARLTFAGAAGQRVSLSISGVTIANSTVTILNPNGTTLASVGVGTGGAFIDAQTLPVAGTYTIIVDPSSTNTGSATLTLFDVPADVNGPIQPGGTPVTVTTTVPGQNARLTFAGAYGQRVTVNFSGNSIPGSTSVALVKPDGTTLTSSSVSLNGTRFFDTQTLPAGGTYAIVVDPQTVNTGGISVQLFDASDVNANAITPGGAAVTVNVPTAGQSARLTFGGTQGQRVSLRITGVTISGANIFILNPDGTSIAPAVFVSTGGGFFDAQTLPVTGTYTILVDPSLANTGSATLQLFDVPADLSGSVTVGGVAATVTTTVPGQNGRLTFGGTAGQRVTVRVTGNTMSTTAVSLLNPDGTQLASATSSGASFNLTTQTLPVTDTYTIKVDPNGANVGSLSVNVTDDGTGTPGVLDVAANITVGGAPVTVTTATAGQNARLTFNGTYGQRVSLNLSGNTIPSTTTVFIVKPDGTNLASVSVSLNNTAFLDAQTLPANGTYTILVDPPGTNVGSLTVKLNDASDAPATTITPGGAPVTVSPSTPGQNARVTFAGAEGQRVSLSVSGVTIANSNVTLLSPDGTQLATVFSGTGGAFIDAQTLPVAGTYTILVDPGTTNTGSITLTLFNVPADVNGAITPGGPAVAVTTTTAGQNARLTFAGTYGQRVTVNFSGNTIPGSTSVVLLRPDGTNVTSSSVSLNGTRFFDTQTLPLDGTYTILVDPSTTNVGGLTVQLHDAGEVDAGTITPGGPPVTTNLNSPGQSARLTFGGTAGQRVSLNLTGVTIPGGSVSILNPDGTALVSATSFSTGGVFVEPRTLPVAGTYTIIVDPNSTNTGSATLQLFDVPSDEAGAITPGGPAVAVTSAMPGQNQRLTFNGAYGQRVSVSVSGNSITGTTNVALLRPDGTIQASVNVSLNNTTFIDTQSLSMNGAYALLVNPSSTNTGSMTVQLNDASEALTGTITPGGPAVTVNIPTAGQAARLTFVGAAGQRVSLSVSGVTIANSTVTILNPNGTTLASVGVGTGGAFIDAQTLPVAGTYTIIVDPSSTNTGSATLTLFDVPSDDAGAITPGGAPVTVAAAVPGQNQRLTFAGTFGQRVSVSLSANSITGSTSVVLVRPDGTNVASTNVSLNGTGFIDAQSLPMPGTYTLLVNPSTTNVGGMTVQLNDANEFDAGAIAPNEAAVEVTIAQPGRTARLTFSGTAGQQVTAHVANNTMSTATVSIINPDGTVLTSFASSAATFSLTAQTLPTSGTFLIRIDPSGANAGGMSVSLISP